MSDISIVIPAYNEQDNVLLLYAQLKKVLDPMKKDYEIIFIDDGSTDRTYENLASLNRKDRKVKIIKLRKNFGQTAAMDAGFKNAAGDVIIALDADLQNDPEDIPKLLKKLDEGYDAVSGWRYKRSDPFSKKVFSWIANTMRKAITGEKIHDSGCSLKAYRKECFRDLNLYGEMHRFIPAILMWKGFKVGEVKVEHRPRKSGKTKYTMVRLIKGFLDLIVVAFWQKYSARPIHLFGTLGIVSFILGFIIGLYLTFTKLYYHEGIANRPILLLAVLLVIVGVQFIIFGLITDILIKIYYKDGTNYSIEKIE
jgi:glycosyltransferase involved in cell wall biosynthesis